MINHGRNLLLNVSPRRFGASDVGYEYMPPTFTPFRLTDSLAVIHRVLFGEKPDNKFLNLRAKELLGYVHETEFASYLYKLDKRVTYWPQQERPDFLYNKKVTLTQISGEPRRVAVGGTFSASNTTGAAEKNFLLDLTTANEEYTATIQPIGGSAAAPIATSFAAFSAAETIIAPETAIRFSFAAAGSVSTTARMLTEVGDLLIVENYDPRGYLLLEDGDAQAPLQMRALPRLAVSDSLVARWLVNIQANPAAAITTIMPTLELLGEPVFLDLFGVADIEPYLTFKNLWFDHPLPNYRLAGLVLAFIYRAEEQRLKNG